MTDLNTLVPGGGVSMFLIEATAINSRGQFAVFAFDANTGHFGAFLATPRNGGLPTRTLFLHHAIRPAQHKSLLFLKMFATGKENGSSVSLSWPRSATELVGFVQKQAQGSQTPDSSRNRKHR